MANLIFWSRAIFGTYHIRKRAPILKENDMRNQFVLLGLALIKLLFWIQCTNFHISGWTCYYWASRVQTDTPNILQQRN